MPKLGVKKREYLEPTIGDDFILFHVGEIKETKTQRGMAENFKVQAEPVKRKKTDDNIYNFTCWMPEQGYYGEKSALGAVITALEQDEEFTGNSLNTDDWSGVIMRVLEWKKGNHKVKYIGQATDKRVAALAQAYEEATTRTEE